MGRFDELEKVKAVIEEPTSFAEMAAPLNKDSSLTIREWMTTREAAAYLRVSVATLRNMTSNGEIPYRKLGRRNRYLLVELRQLLNSQKRGCHGY